MWSYVEVFEKQPTDLESNEVLEIKEQLKVQGSIEISKDHNDIVQELLTMEKSHMLEGELVTKIGF